MKNRFFLFLFSLFSLTLVGCVNVSYVGKSYFPTREVTFFYGKSTVPKDTYTVMGKAIATGKEGASGDRIKKDLIEKAKAEGANALVIISTKRVMSEQRYTWNDPYMENPNWGWDCDYYWDGPYGDPYGEPFDWQPETSVEFDYETVVRALFLKKIVREKFK